jgi:hypothetical protein
VLVSHLTVAEQRPLCWSHVPITFEVEDHLERTTGLGLLPLVVAPMVNNIVVIKMSAHGGEGLNLISTKLMGNL